MDYNEIERIINALKFAVAKATTAKAASDRDAEKFAHTMINAAFEQLQELLGY